MRILLKILRFPVVLVLTVLVAFCRFFCLFSGMVLGIVAVLLFLIGLLVLFAGRVDGFTEDTLKHLRALTEKHAAGSILADGTGGRL